MEDIALKEKKFNKLINIVSIAVPVVVALLLLVVISDPVCDGVGDRGRVLSNIACSGTSRHRK